MAAHKLVKVNGCYYVKGLASSSGAEDTILLNFGFEDCDTVHRNGSDMHNALYDLYQVNDGLKDGDTFLIRGKIRYACEGVHVVKIS